MDLSSLQGATEADAKRFREMSIFWDVLTQFASETPRISSDNSLIRYFVREEDVFWIGAFIIGRHFSGRDGITTAQVQAFGRDNGLASPNRIVALMAFLRYGGYLRPVPQSLDRRERLFTVAPGAVAIARTGYAVPLACLSRLIESPDLASLLWQDERLLAFIVRTSLDRFTESGSILKCVPDMRLFTQRLSGYDILLRLVSRYRPQADAEGGGAIFFPFDELAKSAGVSRAHVRRLMADAERLGFVRLPAHGGRAVQLLPKAVDELACLVSLQLASVHQGVKRFLASR